MVPISGVKILYSDKFISCYMADRENPIMKPKILGVNLPTLSSIASNHDYFLSFKRLVVKDGDIYRDTRAQTHIYAYQTQHSNSKIRNKVFKDI